MTDQVQIRGAAPVGLVKDLDPVEAGAVLGLRAWCDGPAALHAYQTGLSHRVGHEYARSMGESLSQICDLCFRHGRRPLARHNADCKCLGADENCFANFIAAAAQGDREDAMLFATLLVRADFAPCMTGLAEHFGGVLQLAARAPAKTYNTNNVIKLH